MLQLLQTLQIILFTISIVGWFILGLLILVNSVLVLHRRMFLLIFLPILAANPLALFEELALPAENASLDWRVWAILVVDLALAVAGYWLLTGWEVYGLSERETEGALKTWCEALGWELDSQSAERKTLWGGNSMGIRLTLLRKGQPLVLWLLGGANETRIEGETPKARECIRQMLPALRRVEKPYRVKEHLTGALYIVLAVVLAVLAWIFFFEPRLILID